MPELSLDDQQWDSFARELNGVAVPELVGRETTPDTGHRGGAAQLPANQRGRARGAACRAVQYTADWELGAQFEPGPELLKGPAVHPDLASSPALTGADHDGAAVSVKIGLGQGERFADPQPCAPQHHDHAA